MKALQIHEYHSDLSKAIEALQIVDKPVPEPEAGQVLVKMEAAPCNPSDLLFMQGRYGIKKTLPAVPGWEGAGTVVKSGGGVLGWWLNGKRVACGGQSDRDGTWAEYVIADAKTCIPLKQALPIEQGASLIVNPLTAVGLVAYAKDRGHRAIMQSAACSQVGKMVQALAKRASIAVINIVRREEQKHELTESEHNLILNSSDELFFQELKSASKKLNATLFIDAVAGEMTGEVLEIMPKRSKALVYGALSGGNCAGISPLSLIFEEKKVEGFWLSQWIGKQYPWQIFQQTNFLQNSILEGSFGTKVAETVSIDEWKKALHRYTEKMTSGKMVLTFQ